jgi:ribosomal protein S18 acetylase RimI-like enzyme
MTFKIRKAESKDIPFLIQSIFQSEKIGTDIISYCTLFDIDENTLNEQLTEAFIEDYKILPWNLKNWYVSENEIESPLAALAFWLEPENSNSEIQKFQYLSFVNKSKVAKPEFTHRYDLLKQVAINREPNHYQFDFLYTKIEFRGQGIMLKMMKDLITQSASSNFQIQVLKSNSNAKKLYERIGFVENKRITLNGLKENKLLADNTKINMFFYGKK